MHETEIHDFIGEMSQEERKETLAQVEEKIKRLEADPDHDETAVYHYESIQMALWSRIS